MQPPASPGPETSSFRPDSAPYLRPPAKRSAMELLMAVFGIILGILIFVGFLSFQAIYLVPVPCSAYSCPAPTAQQAAYEGLIQTLAWMGLVALDLSVGLSVTIAFILGLRSDVPETTKRSVFLFATVYLVAFTIFGLFFLTSLISIVRYF